MPHRNQAESVQQATHRETHCQRGGVMREGMLRLLHCRWLIHWCQDDPESVHICRHSADYSPHIWDCKVLPHPTPLPKLFVLWMLCDAGDG
jgi:hypothetical protein